MTQRSSPIRVEPQTTSRVIGRGKDPNQLAERLLAGRSVVLVGEFGFGRSFLADAIAERLRDRGVEPIVLSDLTSDDGREPDAVETIHRSATGRGRPAPTDRALGPVIIRVDDAQLLPSGSMRRLVSLVQSRSAVVLLTSTPVAESRCTAVSDSPDRDTGRAINELWIECGADRVDIRPLSDAEADEFVAVVLPDVRLDAATRALIYANSGGSPWLISELATAAAAIDDGELALTGMADLVARSPRILDLVQHRLVPLTDSQLVALATLHVTGALPLGALTSVITRADIRALSQHGCVRPDYRETQTVTPRSLFAGAAYEIADPDSVHQMTGALTTVILRDPDHVPSPSLSVAIAAQWESENESAAVARWGQERVAAVLLRAASACNAARDVARAERFAVRSAHLQPSILSDIERSRSLAHRGRVRSALGVVSAMAFENASPTDLPRALGWWAELAASLPDPSSELRNLENRVHALEADGLVAPSLCAWVRAVASFVAGDGNDVIALGTRLLDDPEVDLATRIRAGNAAAVALSRAGHGQRALDLLGVVESLVGDADEVAAGSSDFRAMVSMTDAVVRCVGGFDVDTVSFRLRELSANADAFGATDVLAGICVISALLALHEGNLARADVELHSALRRLDRVDAVGWREWMLWQVEFVAARQRAINLAEDAVASAHAARIERARRVRAADQFGAAALGWETFEQFQLGDRSAEIVDRLETAAAATDSPLLTTKALFARATLSNDPDLLDESAQEFAALAAFGLATEAWWRAARAHEERGNAPAAEVSHARAMSQGRRAGISIRALEPNDDEERVRLTRREVEVAELAASGQSDREIAAVLFLSVRTVESHLHQARRKLGVDSRRELAAVFAARAG